MHPLKTKRRKLLALLLLAYASTMLFGGCANTLILYPTTDPLDDTGTAHQLLIETAPNKKIEVWIDRSPGAAKAEPQAFLIEFTGNATRAEQIASNAAARWGDRPVEVWAVNYPGYGASTGPAKLSDIGPAALAVHDHVAKLASGRPILLGANSLGTAAALHVAARRPTVAGLVLQNPPALRSLIVNQYGWWNLWLLAGPISWQVPSDLDSPTNAAQTKAPALFILADDDTFVVPSNQLKTVNAHAGPKKTLHITGGHNDGIPPASLPQLNTDLTWLWNLATRQP